MTACCPRCHAALDAPDPHVTDGPNGIVLVTTAPVATERRHCICGWTWTIASTRTAIRQPHLTVVEGAA